MLAPKMFATTLLSQQIHDTVCSVGKGRVRYRIGGEWLYVVAVAMKEEYKSYKSHFLLLYSSPPPILRYTPLVQVFVFLIVAKSGAYYSTFLRTLNMKSSNGSENAEIPVYNAYRRCFGVWQPVMGWVIGEGEKKAICLPGANRILIRFRSAVIVVGWFGRETKCTPSLGDGKTWYV